jgi:hypothetical protein
MGQGAVVWKVSPWEKRMLDLRAMGLGNEQRYATEIRYQGEDCGIHVYEVTACAIRGSFLVKAERPLHDILFADHRLEASELVGSIVNVKFEIRKY